MSAAEIYQQAILALANDATGHGSLPAPDARAFLDNPLCGDNVEMQVRLADGRIAAVAHEVKGCLLCRAAASVLGKHAIGATRAEIEQASAAVSDLLDRQSPPPAGWEDLSAFTPVHGHRSRYRCVTLPFEALLVALGLGQ